MTYAPDNVFAKILRGEVPCQAILETPYAMAFRDAYPTHEVHILVIPKGPYQDFNHFLNEASDDMQKHFWEAVKETMAWIRQKTGIQDMKCLTNIGPQAGQTVFHFHLHLLGGKPLHASDVP